MPYAKGKYALGVCDRTGFVYKLKDLRNQIVDQRRTGLMVGKDVLDKDQPQYQIGRLELKKDLCAPFYPKLKQLLHHSYLYIVVRNSTCII